MSFEIRPYQENDLPSLYQICLQTGHDGSDASGLFNDPQLLGHYYSAPYAIFEPDTCFVATQNARVVGYIVGCKSSQLFSQQCENEWFPALREHYPINRDISAQTLDDKIISLLHKGHQPRPEFIHYPAHLHINLLPETQGAGLGKKLMQTFIANLCALKVPGIHLEVSTDNKKAISFYEKLGFTAIAEFEYSIGYGMQLSSPNV